MQYLSVIERNADEEIKIEIQILYEVAGNEQGIIVLEVIRKNSLELIRAVDRAKTVTITVTITSLRTAVTIAGGFYNQKIVLEKVNALNVATKQMLGATALLLREQRVSV